MPGSQVCILHLLPGNLPFCFAPFLLIQFHFLLSLFKHKVTRYINLFTAQSTKFHELKSPHTSLQTYIFLRDYSKPTLNTAHFGGKNVNMLVRKKLQDFNFCILSPSISCTCTYSKEGVKSESNFNP